MKTRSGPHSRIGVVIIGRNEGERLIRCLQSLFPTEMPVVYVDSGSTDGSVADAKAYGAEVVALDLSVPFTAARARNMGFATLKNHCPSVEFVQFIDGDCSLVSGWLSIALAFLTKHKDVAVVCGRRREINPEGSVYNWLCDIEWDTLIGQTVACGGDALIRVAPFEQCGGYRESLVAGEEPELCLRLRELGWKIWRIDVDLTRHDAAITKFTQWWRRCRRGGYGMIEVAILHILSPSRIWARESARAIVYGGIVPAIFIAGAVYPPLFLIALVYPLLILKIAGRHGVQDPRSWTYALMVTISKFAEFTGIVNFTVDRLRRRRRKIIEYK